MQLYSVTPSAIVNVKSHSSQYYEIVMMLPAIVSAHSLAAVLPLGRFGRNNMSAVIFMKNINLEELSEICIFYGSDLICSLRVSFCRISEAGSRHTACSACHLLSYLAHSSIQKKGGSTFFRNVEHIPDYTVLHPRR
jgi:hypothetical protein